jgi:hypothetical protein
MLTRETLLQPMARKFRDVPLSNGETDRIRNLNELELAQFRTATLVKDDKGELQTDLAKVRTQPRRLIVMCSVDADGNPKLSESDIPALGKVDGRIIAELYRACQEHCGLVEEVAAAENAEKNLEPTGG